MKGKDKKVGEEGQKGCVTCDYLSQTTTVTT